MFHVKHVARRPPTRYEGRFLMRNRPSLSIATQRMNGSNSRNSFGFGWAPTMLLTNSPSW